ncbi:hypothetical protein JOL79_32655 [Microbispora sp. RL4-1S]|uniref:Copper resistance protein CopC n=1 Tax=Microbispora oryzae TaxID=2806554 RepID=A0A940WRX6_9ACTN|nr:hypothetical protein [Microbispora oryzae]MBP2708532.1 hypothetical protein [Microbispora oryzae]
MKILKKAPAKAPMRALSYALTALLAGLVLVLGAPAASAHGGAIELQVTGDGGHDVNVLVTWKKDHHPVTDIVAATLTATSSDGRTFGPVQLKSAPEGQNLYHSEQPLPAGDWKVTVTATEPAKAKATTEVSARDIAAPAPQAANVLPGAPAVTATTATDDGSVLGMLVKVAVIALVAALALVALVFLARRNRLDLRR